MSQLFEVIDIQTYDGAESGINRYFFDQPTSAVIDAEDVGNAFISQWLDVIRGVQSQEVDHGQIYVRDVEGAGGEALVTVFAGVGSRGGDCQPSFVQWSYYLKPVSGSIKRGAKRYMGVSEDDTNSNIASGGIGSRLSNLEDLLKTGLDVAGTALAHAIVRKVLDGNNAIYTIAPVIGAVYRMVSTQRSRLAGGGALAIPGLGLTPSEVTASDLSSLVDADFTGKVTAQQALTWEQYDGSARTAVVPQ